MSDLKVLGALYAFMLIPVWIPLIAVAASRIYDAVGALKKVRPIAPSRPTQQIPVPQTGDPS